MPNFYLSPNMSLVIPVVGVEIGPDWASEVNASLTILDAHTHSPGSGAQITPDGININADLTFNNTNNIIKIRSVRFFPNLTTLSLPDDLGVLYESGVDLYYNDGSGNQIRITQSGNIAGAAGTITGLPSGTASAAFLSVSGTFQFLQATNLGANLDIGTLVLRYPGSYPTPSGNYIALQVPSSISSGYAITFPATTPTANGAFLTEDTSGILSYTYVDNLTVEINAGLLRVKPLGVATANLADGSITSAKLADGSVIPSKLSNINLNNSGSSGGFSTFSSSYVAVSNLSVAITTGSRPVMVFFAGDGGGGSFVSCDSASAGQIKIERDSIVVHTTFVGGPNSLPTRMPIYTFVDYPGPGAHTYIAYAKVDSTGTLRVNNSRIIAYEL